MKFNKYWFKPKVYGLGAYPSTWEGWSLVIGFLALVIANMYFFNPATWTYHLNLLIIVVLLIYISYKKTDGKWKWSWGKIK